jgi:hypothetical protein
MWLSVTASRAIVTRARNRDPPVETVHLDPRGPLGHLGDRPQRLAGQPPPAKAGEQEKRRPGKEQERDDTIDRGVNTLERGSNDERHRTPAAHHPGGEDAKRLRVVPAMRRGRHVPSGEHRPPLIGGEQRLPREVGPGQRREAAVGPDELRACVAGQHAQHRRAERGSGDASAALERLADLGGAGAERVLGVTFEVRTQPSDDEDPEGGDHRCEQEYVPERHPQPDRKSHSGSSAYPTPRTVRIRTRPKGRSSLRRR